MFMEVAWSAAAPVTAVSESLQEEPAPMESISLPPSSLYEGERCRERELAPSTDRGRAGGVTLALRAWPPESAVIT